MIYLALLILIVTVLQFIVALMNRLFREDYGKYKAVEHDLVSVIVPARNEEIHIGKLLKQLRLQTYKNLEIIVVDDDSTDQTGAIVMDQAKEDNRIHLIRTTLREKSWLGKNHACYQGAISAEGKHLLFIDADVQLGPTAIDSLMGYYQHRKTVFLSVFPRQLLPNREVSEVVPVMNYILLSLLLLILVRKSPFTSLSAANGQVMLFDRQIYEAFQPHKKFKREKVEDISIARFLKSKRFRIACLTGNEDIACNMYSNREEALEGFSKNVVAFFGNSYFAAITFWFISFTGLLWVTIGLGWSFGFIYLALTAAIRVMISKSSKQDSTLNLRLHYIQLYRLGTIIYKSLNHRINKTYQWKGRNIS